MRIVYKNGIPCKVDAQGRLIASKFRPFGGKYGQTTVCLRVPLSIVPAVMELCHQAERDAISERINAIDNPDYTTPGFENKEIFDNE